MQGPGRKSVAILAVTALLLSFASALSLVVPGLLQPAISAKPGATAHHDVSRPTPWRLYPRGTLVPGVEGDIDPTTGEIRTPAPIALVAGDVHSLVLPSNLGPADRKRIALLVIVVTPTPVPTLTPTITPTHTPEPPTATLTPTSTPTPSVLAEILVAVASAFGGPGKGYPQIAALSEGAVLTVTGRNRNGDWWQVCCVAEGPVWLPASVVHTSGPLWVVPEIIELPTIAPTPTPIDTVTPTPTKTWPMHLQFEPRDFPLGQPIFRVSALIWDGTTPLWGYRLRVRNTTTGQEWLSEGSQAFLEEELYDWPNPDQKRMGQSVKRNVKWDSLSVSLGAGDEVWEVMVTDGGGAQLSSPVRLITSKNQPRWYYLVFTNRK